VWRVLLFALIAIGCGGRPLPDRFHVTLIGIDGAAWRVIDPMFRRGDLPNVRALVEAGVRAPLRSQQPLISPAVWTTIASGVSRERHGIQLFKVGDRLVSSVDRKVPALWTLASEAGLRSAVIGWWATYPAEAINGVVVSERALKTREDDLRSGPRAGLPGPETVGLVHPANVLDTVADLLVAGETADEQSDERGAVVRRMRAEDRAVAESLVRLRGTAGPFDLEMALLRGVDPISHYFWKYYEPDAPVYKPAERPTADELKTWGGAVEDHYRYVDGLLGELGARPSPDHVILLVSDHGFEAGRQQFHRGVLSGTHAGEAALHGIFVASGGPIRRGLVLDEASVLDVAPTILYLLGLPVPDDLEGKVLDAAIDRSWRDAHPVRHVPPHATAASEQGPPPTSAVDERLQRELKALGYVE